MIYALVFLGVACVVLVVAWLYWLRETAPGTDRNADREGGWLFSKRAEEVQVRSADNVRMLSDEQLDALEAEGDE